ncbi:MAG: ThiF family adenylyltransferase, partial [Bacilli bacterium]
MERYSRQILFSKVGEEGQQLLANKHVCIIGCGAIGTSCFEHFVRAGVGTITIIDRDYVEMSNLQRQQLFTEEDAINYIPKAIAAKNHGHRINSSITIHAFVDDITPSSIEKYLTSVDIILDGSDNFDTRFLINDAAYKYHIPWIYGGCLGSSGMTYTFLPSETPCLSCILETAPQMGYTCDNYGILSPTVSHLTSFQVMECLKYLLGMKDDLQKKYVTFDLWTNQHFSINMTQSKKENCDTCGEHPNYPYLYRKSKSEYDVLCGRDTVQLRSKNWSENQFILWKSNLKYQIQFKSNDYLLSFHFKEKRFVIFKDG